MTNDDMAREERLDSLQMRISRFLQPELLDLDPWDKLWLMQNLLIRQILQMHDSGFLTSSEAKDVVKRCGSGIKSCVGYNLAAKKEKKSE